MDTEPPPQNTSTTPPTPPRLRARFRLRFDWRIAAGLLVALVSLPLWRATTSHAKPGTAPLPPALPVAVAAVTREDLDQELVCDAELRPYEEIDLHAKVAGYLQDIKVDIGDRVQAGQLLATLEVPELQDDVRRAVAASKRAEEEVARAEAAYDEAQLTYDRLAKVAKAQPNYVAQQEVDDALAKERTSSSALAAAKAEVDVARAEASKLQTMVKYCHITAPFPGVITARYADPGALIQAGTSSSTQTLPLVRLSQADKLRLDIPVSVSYVARIEVGEPVEIRVESLNRTFTGAIARTTGKLETSTRTMLVQVDVPNPDLKLIPGMYASATLQLARHSKTLAVPVEAVSRAKACTVYVVDHENKIEERVVRLGLETPHKLEVLDGLKEHDLVMIGNRSQVKPGQRVEPKVILANAAE